MDINLLVLNLGNSRLASGTFIAGELSGVARTEAGNQEQWEAHIAQAWKQIYGRENAAIVGASVNPVLIESLEYAVEQATGRRITWIGREIDLPINVNTDQPLETGVDRVLNVAAAYEQMQKACVIVDAGTAITIDCCNDNGDFLGGAIAPGVTMMLDALHQKTAKLPRIEFDRPQGAYGKNTRQAILQGIYHGVRGMVKELVENYAMELGNWPEIIATGGDAKVLFEGWELIHAISPDLTLYGIALAYAEHHMKHGT
jgi:type III pantothenate kinase